MNANATIKLSRKPQVEAILSKRGLKGTLSVSGKCALVLKLRSGSLDFAKGVSFDDEHYLAQAAVASIPREIAQGHCSATSYRIDRCWKGEAREVLRELHEAMSPGQGESYFVEVLIGGGRDKPYKLVQGK